MKNPAIPALLVSLAITSTSTHALDTGDVSFDPEALKFPSILVTTCRPKKIEARNDSDTPIQNPGFSVVGDDDGVFSIQSGFRKCNSPLAPGETCSMYVDFCPQAHESYSASLVFAESELSVPIEGHGSAGPAGGR